MKKVLITIGLIVSGMMGWLFYERPEPPFGSELTYKYYYEFKHERTREILKIETDRNTYYGLATRDAKSPTPPKNYKFERAYEHLVEPVLTDINLTNTATQ